MSKLKTSTFLLDISWLANVFYWAGKSNDEENSGLSGIIYTLKRLKSEFHPYSIIACIDSKTNFRKQIDPTYKGNRPEKDEGFVEQLKLIIELLNIMGIPCLCEEGFESDDITATICKLNKSTNTKNVIVSGDKDLKLMLEASKTGIYKKGVRKPWFFYGQKDCETEHGIRIEQFLDWMILVGDVADNIITVKNCGPKKATDLLNRYDTIEGIYENLSELPLKMQENLKIFEERLDTVRQLVTLRTDVGDFSDLGSYKTSNIRVNKEELRKFLSKHDLSQMYVGILEIF